MRRGVEQRGKAAGEGKLGGNPAAIAGGLAGEGVRVGARLDIADADATTVVV